VRILLLALVTLGCRSMDSSHEVVDTGKGVPAGWDATEKTELRTGAWRFYRIQARDPQLSVREDNLVLRDVTRMSGSEGIESFIREQRLREKPDGIPPTRLAEQLAMFLVRGESRRESFFKVVTDPAADAPGFASHAEKLHPPETRIVEHDLFVHRSWILHGGIARHLVVEVGRDGTAKADLTEWLPDDPPP
jgi:hypothetical protein